MGQSFPFDTLDPERPFSEAEWAVLKDHVTGSALRQLQLPAFTEGRVRARFRAGLRETLEQKRRQAADLALWIQDVARRHPSLSQGSTLGLAPRLAEMAKAELQADRDRNPVIAYAGDLALARAQDNRADAVIARRRLRQALGTLASAEFEDAALDLAQQEGAWPHWAFYLPIVLGVEGVARGHLQMAEPLERVPAAVGNDLAALSKPISAVATQMSVLAAACGDVARASGEALPARLIRALATREAKPANDLPLALHGGTATRERPSYLRLV